MGTNFEIIHHSVNIRFHFATPKLQVTDDKLWVPREMKDRNIVIVQLNPQSLVSHKRFKTSADLRELGLAAKNVTFVLGITCYKVTAAS